MVRSLHYHKRHSWFHPTGEEAESLANKYWDYKKDKDTSTKARKNTSMTSAGTDLEKPASRHQTQSSTKNYSNKKSLGMSTIAARDPTKSSSKKSCKNKSMTGAESSSKRGQDGEETDSCREKQPPTQKSCPTRIKKIASLVTTKKKGKECNEKKDKVRGLLFLICGTISGKNAQLTL